MFREALREPDGSAARTGDPSRLGLTDMVGLGAFGTSWVPYLEAPPADTVIAAAFDSARVADNANASAVALERAYDQRMDAMTKAGIKHNLNNPQRMAPSSVPGEMGEAPEMRDYHSEFDRQLYELHDRETDPVKRSAIKIDRSVREEAKEIAREAEQRFNSLWERAPNFYGLSSVARFAGGFAGGMYDPVNIAALGAGPFGRVGIGAKELLWMGIKQGAVNAGAAAVAQPAVQKWRRDAGLDYGLAPALENIGMAAAFGAIDPAVRVAARGFHRARGNLPILDKEGKIEGWQRPAAGEPGTASLPGKPIPADAALDRVARNARPGSVLRNAADGDLNNLHRLAKETGVADDPAMIGARQAAEIEADLAGKKPAFVDDGEAEAKMAQMLRAAVDENEPMPRGVDPVLPARKGFELLADDGPTPPGKNYKFDGKPVSFREVPASEIGFDAATFQFKGGGNAEGVTRSLAGVEGWDPIAAGRSIVFERADGSKVIADGHQRLGLAKRLEQTGHEPINMPATIFREADGWTAADVRAIAARKNIQEGSGDVLDIARVLRDRPDIMDASVPLTTHAMRQARSLARLSDEAFAEVVSGRVQPNHAALVGDLVEARSQHASILRALADAEPNNEREARHIIGDLMHGPQHEVQERLLGSHGNSSLLAERAQVLDRALKLLKEDAKIFDVLLKEAERISQVGNRLAEDANSARLLQSETVSALIETLATKPGPVREWLDDAARSVAGGTKPKDAAKAFANDVRKQVMEHGIDGLKPDAPPPLRGARGIDDPGGPEARQQLKELEEAMEQTLKGVVLKNSEKHLARWLNLQRSSGRSPLPIDPVVRAEAVKLIAAGEHIPDAIRQARQAVKEQEVASAQVREEPLADTDPKFAEAAGGGDDAELIRALTSVPRWTLDQQAFADVAARRKINAAVEAGQPIDVPIHIVATGHGVLKSMRELLPSDWSMGLVRRVEPIGGGDVRLLLIAVDGSIVEIVRPWHEIRDSRAITFPGDRFIALFRPDLIRNFRHSVGGEVWHELVHAVFVSDAADRLNDVSRRLLVRHAESLRVLDMVANDFNAKIGRRDLVRPGRPTTLRQIYERNYSTRFDPDALIAEEAVAHMVELIHHGALKSADVSPILPILDRAFGEQLTRRLKANDAAAKFLFAGPRAFSADLTKLDAAQAMDAAGRSDLEIFDTTGWFRDTNGEWIFQVPKDDMQLRMRPEKIAKGQFKTKFITGRASELAQAPRLFDAYPELADIEVNLQHRKTAAAGVADFEAGSIDVIAGSEKQMHARLLEQLQRFVNEIEQRPAAEPRAMAAIRKAAEDLDREAATALEKLAAMDDAGGKVKATAADRKALLKQIEELRRARAELDQADWTVAWKVAARRSDEEPPRLASAGEDVGDDWEASLFDELSRRSAAVETARDRAEQGRAKAGTILRQEEHPLLRDIGLYERAQWKAGKTAEEIAAAIEAKFGLPVDPGALARREVWWNIEQTLRREAGKETAGHWPADVRAEFTRLWEARTPVTAIRETMANMLGRPVSAGAVAQQRVRQGLAARTSGPGKPALSDAARRYALERLAARADNRRVTSSMIAKEIGERYGETVSPEYLRVLAQRSGLAGDPNAVWTSEVVGLLTSKDIAGLSVKEKAAVLRAHGVQASYDTVWRKVRELGQAKDQEPRFAIANDEWPPLPRGRNITDAMEDATKTADLSELVRACRA